MLLEFFPLILAFSFAASCPASVSPYNDCVCSVEPNGNVNVKCSSIETHTALSDSLSEFEGLTIHTLTFEYVVLLYIPEDTFHGMDVQVLYFVDSHIMRYSETEVAFEGLEDSLKKLFFIDCTYMDSWNWYQFHNLEEMTSLVIYGSDMQAVHDDVQDIRNLKLEIFSISDSYVSHIDDHAFASFDTLRVFQMSSNTITEVKRSMLPDPADELNTIDLADNELTNIPEDFFTNMPRLEMINLAGNRLTTLNKEAFAPVKTQLVFLDASNNHLTCDCKLKWLQEEPQLPTMHVNCNKPGKEELTDLQSAVLRC